MPAPILKLPKRNKPPVIIEEDDAEEVEVVETDDSQPPQRRLSLPKSSAVVPIIAQVPVVPDLTDEQVSQEIEKAVKRASSFGYKAEAIRQYLDAKDYENASLTAKHGLLNTVIEILPLAERSLRKSNASKGIYQFVSLVNQVRELLVDLDGERDMQGTIQSILDSAIHPVFMTMAQQVIQFQAALKRRMRSEFTEQECRDKLYPMLDEHINELAKYVQGMYEEVRRRTSKTQ